MRICNERSLSRAFIGQTFLIAATLKVTNETAVAKSIET